MKTYYKEILSISISLLIAAGVIYYYFASVQDEKYMERFDLYSLVDPAAASVIVVNQSNQFRDVVKKTTITPPTSIRPVYNLLLQQQPIAYSAPYLIVNNNNTNTFLAKLTNKEMRKLEKQLTTANSYGYHPVTEQTGDIQIHYYPQYGGLFWGYFYNKGILAISDSRKVLNKTALCLHNGAFPDSSHSFSVHNRVISHSIADIYVKSADLLSGIDTLGIEEWKEAHEWIIFNLETKDNRPVIHAGLQELHLNDSTVMAAVNDSVYNRLIHDFHGLQPIDYNTEDSSELSLTYGLR